MLFSLEEPRTKRIVLKKEQDEDVKRLCRILILFSQEQHISLSGYPRYGCAPRFTSAMRNVALVASYMAADPFLESARPGPASTRGGAGLPILETARRLRPARMGVDVNEDHLAVVII